MHHELTVLYSALGWQRPVRSIGEDQQFFTSQVEAKTWTIQLQHESRSTWEDQKLPASEVKVKA
jgi:hypothetical protein